MEEAADEPGGAPGPADRAAIVVETAISPFCTVATDGTVTWASESIVELLGVPAADLIDTNFARLLLPESLERLGSMLDRYLSAGPTTKAWLSSGFFLDFRHADGSAVPCDVAVATPVRTGLREFTLQLRRRGEAAHLQAALVNMAEDLPLPRVLDRIAQAVAASHSLARAEIHLGWDSSGFEMSSSNDGYSVVADDVLDEPGERPWRRALEECRSVAFDAIDELPETVRRWVIRLGITSCWAQPVVTAADISPSGVLVVWRAGEVDWVVFPSYEVDRMVRLVAIAHQWHRGRMSLQFAASHDPLTGLANRRTLLEELRTPAPANESGTVLFCDVDDFKPVNDDHGHVTGDAVLQVVGERLRQAVRPSDLVARYGGDEFVVYCPGTIDPGLVDEVARRLEDALQQPISLGDLTVQVGLSVGRSEIAAGADVDDVLTAAARDMNEVKRRRKTLR